MEIKTENYWLSIDAIMDQLYIKIVSQYSDYSLYKLCTYAYTNV